MPYRGSKNRTGVTDLLTGLLTFGAVSPLVTTTRKPGQPAAQPVNPAGSLADAGAMSVAAVMDAGVSGPLVSLYHEVRGELTARFGTVKASLVDYDVPGVSGLRGWWLRHKAGEVTFPRRFTESASGSQVVATVYPSVPLDITKGALKVKMTSKDLELIVEDPDEWVERQAAKAAAASSVIWQVKTVETLSMLAGPEGAIASMARSSIMNKALPPSVALYTHTAMMPHRYHYIKDFARKFGDRPTLGFIGEQLVTVLAKQRGITSRRELKKLRSQVSKGWVRDLQRVRTEFFRELNENIVSGRINVSSPQDLQQFINQQAQTFVNEQLINDLAARLSRSGMSVTPDEVRRILESSPHIANKWHNFLRMDLFSHIPAKIGGNVLDDRSLADIRRRAEAEKADLTLELSADILENSPDQEDKMRSTKIRSTRQRINEAAEEFELHPFDRHKFTLGKAYTLYLAAKQFNAENADALKDPVEWFKTLMIGGGNFYRLAGVGIDIDAVDPEALFTGLVQAHPDQVLDGFGRIENGRLVFDGGWGAGPGAVQTMPRFLARNVSAARWSYMLGAMHPVEMARKLFFGELHYQAFYIGTGFADPEVLGFMEGLARGGRSLMNLSEAELNQLLHLLQEKYGNRMGKLMFRQFRFAQKLANNRFYRRWMRIGQKLGKVAKWVVSPQTAAFELYLKKIVRPVLQKVFSRFNPIFASLKRKVLQLGVKLLAKIGIKMTVKGLATVLTGGAWALYEVANILTGGLLDKLIFKPLYYMFLFVVFAVLLVILLIVAPISGVMSGGTSMLAVPPKNKNLQLVVVGEALEPPGAFGIVSVGTACWRQKRLPNGANPSQADTSIDDAICPFRGGYYITQCARDGNTSNYHQKSGAVDFVPDGSTRASLISPVDGIVTFCNTTENCGCRVKGNGGGAIMIYSGGYYYFFLHVYANPDLCERAAAGEIVYVEKGDTIAVGLYEKADACTTGPHVHFEIISENNQHPYGGESCRFLVEKCGKPYSTTCPATCK